MGKVPLQVLKELEHQARQNLCTINFAATFSKNASSCNSTMEKCQHSLNLTFKKVKSKFQKGANPDRVARCAYNQACDYFEILNKRIFIQQRALASLSKSLAHILQRELYFMGNTCLLRREAEMTILQPNLGDSRQRQPETPLPNDFSIASISPPVGGCLRSFRRPANKQMFKQHVKHITNGYVLPFISNQNLP